MDSIVYLQCSKIGGKLRVRITTPGYKNDANCQFPRDIRHVGRKYSVLPGDITLVERGGSYFYSVKSRNVKIFESDVALPTQNNISSFVGKIYNTEDLETECLICMCETKDSVFNPCGHYVCCKTCATRVDKCPMCRTGIFSIIDYNDLK
jgi:hypothetical protein